MRKLTVLLALYAGVALAQAPTKVGYQGLLLKADGTPETGSAQLTFKLYRADTGGSPVWSEVQTILFTQGYYATVLGQTTPLDATVFDGATVWLELMVGTETLTPRMPVDSVPYAVRAGTALNVAAGGTVDTDSVRINGTQVINSSGALVGPAAVQGAAGLTVTGGNTVSMPTSCANGDVLRWAATGSTWSCAPYTTDAGFASYFADGTGGLVLNDTTFSLLRTCNATEVLKWNGTAWACAGDSDSGGDITGVTASTGLQGGGTSGAVSLNVAFAGTGTANTSARSDHDHDTAYYTQTVLNSVGTINNSGNPVDWSKLKSVPSGFADGVDNDSGGTITGVTASTGLSGGGTSGTVSLSVSFGGTGTATTSARSDHNHDTDYYTQTVLSSAGTINNSGNPVEWTKLKSVPSGFVDGVDNDSGGTITGVTASTGLSGGGTSGTVSLSVSFAGNGTTSSAARSDHNHDTAYYAQSVLNSAGTINNSGNPVEWTKLKGVPAGFADGVDNDSGGTVTAVSATGVLTSSGGNTPTITLSGTVPVANGGTGITTAPSAAGQVLKSSLVSGNWRWAVSALVASDIPTGSNNYIQNQNVSSQNAAFAIAGSGKIDGRLDVGGNGAVGGQLAVGPGVASPTIATLETGSTWVAGTGTVSVLSNTYRVSGVGTSFTTQVDSGDIIRIAGSGCTTGGGQFHRVVLVADNTTLWVDVPWIVTTAGTCTFETARPDFRAGGVSGSVMLGPYVATPWDMVWSQHVPGWTTANGSAVNGGRPWFVRQWDGNMGPNPDAQYIFDYTYLGGVGSQSNTLQTAIMLSTDYGFVVGRGKDDTRPITDFTARISKVGDVYARGCYRPSWNPTTGTAGTGYGTCASDARLKKNIQPYAPLLERLARLTPVQWEWRSEAFPESERQVGASMGLVAQDVEKVMPELVTTREDGLKAIQYDQLPVLTLQAVKELKERSDIQGHKVQALERQNAQLARENRELKARLDRIERLVAGSRQRR